MPNHIMIASAPRSPAESEPEAKSPPQIPFDLYGSIVRHVRTKGDLARCLRVCKEFHFHGIGRLYDIVYVGAISKQLVRLRLDEQKDDEAPAATENGVPVIAPDGASTTATALPSGPRSSSPSQAYHGTFLSHLSTFTKTLVVDVNPHLDWTSTPLILPNLIDLHFQPPSSLNSGHWWRLVTPYQLIRALRPAQLVLGGGDESYVHAGLSVSMQMLSPILPWVKEVVIFARDSWYEEHRMPFLHDIPSTVDRLILVVESAVRRMRNHGMARGTKRKLPAYQAEARDLLADLVEDPNLQRREYAWACVGNARVIEIMGVETMKDVRNKRDVERGKEEIRAEVRRWLVRVGWDEVKADARVAGIVFTSA